MEMLREKAMLDGEANSRMRRTEMGSVFENREKQEMELTKTRRIN